MAEKAQDVKTPEQAAQEEVEKIAAEAAAADAAAKAEAAAAAPVAAEEAVEKEALYVSKIPLFNPDQGVYLHETPKAIEVDNWWTCQIDAGLVKKVR